MIIDGPPMPFQHLTAGAILDELCSESGRGLYDRARTKGSKSRWYVSACSSLGTGRMKRYKDGVNLADLVEDYNRRVQLEAFHIHIQDQDRYDGVLRFQLEYRDSSLIKAVRIQSNTPASELLSVLLDKFNVALDTPANKLKASLFQVTDEDVQELEGDECPLQMALELDVIPRFVLRVTPLLSDGGEPSAERQSGIKMRLSGTLPKWLTKKASSSKLLLGSSEDHVSNALPDSTPNRKGRRSAEPSYSTIDRQSRANKVRSVFVDNIPRDGSSSPMPSLKPSRSLEDLTAIGRKPAAVGERRHKYTKSKPVTVAQSMSNMLAIDSQEEKLTVHLDAAYFGCASVDVSLNGGTTAEDIVQQALRKCCPALVGAEAANAAEGLALCDVVGRLEEGLWLDDYARPMADSERPLMLLSLMKPSDGFLRRFEMRQCLPFAALSTESSQRRDRESDQESAASGSLAAAASQFREAKDETEQRLSLSSPSPSSASRTDTMKFPSDSPYFLTVHAYDHQNDYVLHKLEEGVTVMGSASPSASDAPACHIPLRAPDIFPRHCWVHKRTRIGSSGEWAKCTVSLSAAPGAAVKVNEQAVTTSSGSIGLKPGDLISVGEHYAFLFKDPAFKHVATVAEGHAVLMKRRSADGANGRPVSADEWKRACSASYDADNSKNKLSYALDREDELLEKIADIMSPFEEGFKLTPSYLFALALEHSAAKNDQESTKRLVLKISNSLQGSVWDSVKALATSSNDASSSDPWDSVQSIVPGLQPIIFWMSNCSEMKSFFHENLLKYFSPSDALRTGIDSLALEVCGALEETVTYAFQQTVYHLTKALYSSLEVILTGNPFNDSSDEINVRDITKTLELIESICHEMNLNPDIVAQLLCYLFFFIGTCLFNMIMENGSGKQYCNWDVGVKLRKNLQVLETWAAEHKCTEGITFLERIISVADFLSTSNQFLLQAQWSSLRELFPLLNAAQVNRLLELYQLGPNKSRPPGWLPTPEDVKQALATERISENFDNHPPFILLHSTSIELWHEVGDKTFYDYLSYINASFGCRDDDQDSGSYVDDSVPPLPKTNEDPKAVLASPVPTRRTAKQSNNDAARSSGKYSHGYNPLFKKKGEHKRGDSGSSTSSSVDSPLPKPNVTSAAANGRQIAPFGSSLGDSPDVLWDRHLVTEFESGSISSRHNGRGIHGDSLKSARPPVSGMALELTGDDRGARNDRQAAGSFDVVVTPQSPKNELTVLPLDDEQNDYRRVGREIANGKFLQSELDESEIDLLLEEESALSKAHKAALAAFLKGDESEARAMAEDILVVELARSQTGLGLGLIDGLYTEQCCAGIYVKQLIPDSSADKDGRLKLGDRILAVNNYSLVSADFQSALKIMKEAGALVRLLVIKTTPDVAKRIVMPAYKFKP